MSNDNIIPETFHRDLLTKFYNIDPDTYNPLDPTKDSKGSHQLDSVHVLHNVAARLEDCRALLEDAEDVLNDDEPTKKRKKSSAKIASTTRSLLKVVADATRTSANVVSPTAGSGYAHKREEARMRREAASPNHRMRMIDEFVQNNGLPPATTTSSQHDTTPNMRMLRKRKTKGKSLPTTMPDLPKPTNGTECGIGEFLKIATPYENEVGCVAP